MKLKIFLTLLAVLNLALYCGSPKSQLENFLLKDYEIPNNCDLKIINPGDLSDLPFEIKSNPYLSSDQKFLKGFAGERFEDEEELVSEVRSALFSVYEGSRNEVGVFGFEFSSEKYAQRATNILKDRYHSRGYQIYSKNNIVLLLWADSSYDPCFDEMKELVRGKLAEL